MHLSINLFSVINNWISLRFPFKMNAMLGFLSRGHWRDIAGRKRFSSCSWCGLGLVDGVDMKTSNKFPQAWNTIHLWPCSLGQAIIFCSPFDMETKFPTWPAHSFLWPGGLHIWTAYVQLICSPEVHTGLPVPLQIRQISCTKTKGRLTEEQEWKLSQQQRKEDSGILTSIHWEEIAIILY